jgi:hypothetical protein
VPRAVVLDVVGDFDEYASNLNEVNAVGETEVEMFHHACDLKETGSSSFQTESTISFRSI